MWKFAGGVITGGALVYLWHRFGSKAASLGRALLVRANGVVAKAEAHIQKLI